MITTRLLTRREYPKYREWFKSHSTESRRMYFGVSGGDYLVDQLVDRILDNPDSHYFIVAEDLDGWVGTVHIAVTESEVEFGILVKEECRGKGIADLMLTDAIIWARNRGYTDLYMQCLSHNGPIRHLCKKHNLEVTSDYGEAQTKVHLDPPTVGTFTAEAVNEQRIVWHRFLQMATFPLRSLRN